VTPITLKFRRVAWRWYVKAFGEFIALAFIFAFAMIVTSLAGAPEQEQHAKLRVCGFETSGECK
jgi:hypothetical protein